MRTTLFGVMCALLALPATAQTFRAENRVYVTPAPGGFEVSNGGGYGARGMWCAAADYANDVAGAAGTDRRYIARGRTPGIGQQVPVLFSLDQSSLRPSAVFIVGVSLRQDGSTLSVDHAHSFCADAKVINR